MHLDVDGARALAARLFCDLEDRWLHAQGCARKAEEIAPAVGPIDRELLICAAWLHDVGYSAKLVSTGFHPVDGACHLAEQGWPDRLVALVAHHSEARMTAAAQGLTAELARYPREDGPVADALVYADLAAGPRGRRMSLMQRLADMERRHDDDPPALRQARIDRRRPLIRAVERTEQRLSGVRRAATVG